MCSVARGRIGATGLAGSSDAVLLSALALRSIAGGLFVVVPLVFASLALGIVQLGRLDRLGPLAGRTFVLFALNMAIGVALGLPGSGVTRS